MMDIIRKLIGWFNTTNLSYDEIVFIGALQA